MPRMAIRLENVGIAVRDLEATIAFFTDLGLEVEFHLFKLEKAKLQPTDAGQPGEPPDVSLLNQGYQYLTEQRYDEMDPILEILRNNLVDLGLPLRSLEVEYGPSQVEFTFRAGTGLVGEERVRVLEAEGARLVAVGATRVHLLEADGVNESCLVMQDVEGNEFCLD